MAEVKPRYWDVDRCAWVGFDPVHPLTGSAETQAASAAEPAAVPEQREGAILEPVADAEA